MIGRNVQSLKVVVVKLNFRSFYNFITHTCKDTFNFFLGNAVWVAVTQMVLLCRKCDIDDFGFELKFSGFCSKIFLHRIKRILDFLTGFIDHLAECRTFFRRDISHGFHNGCQFAFFT